MSLTTTDFTANAPAADIRLSLGFRHGYKGIRFASDRKPAGMGKLMKRRTGYRRALQLTLAITVGLALAGCGFLGRNDDTAFSDGRVIGVTGGPLRVNAFLWRASLDTLEFMPLSSTDSSGGFIVTEWYAPPDIEDERLKINIHIMDLELRADALRVSVFRQIYDETGRWLDSPVKAGTAQRIEDAILTRARQLRIRSLSRN